ncbi:MAG: hypothetical protein KJ077_13490 [Anaerolineae bacterium]|nr:hypothetical protein [Anaerolineae bacterium]
MKLQSGDTTPNAEQFQISLIRQASIAQRISRVRSLSQTTIRLSRRAILRANPDFSETDLDLAFVAHLYGANLAYSLRNYLDKSSQ